MESYTALIGAIITIIAFLLGKYVWPHVSTESINDVAQKVNIIITYADKFVNWAKQMLSGSTGSQKMAAVVEQLQLIADKIGYDVTEEELTAIAQSAYDAMKAGEAYNESTSTDLTSVVATAVSTAAATVSAVTASATTTTTETVTSDTPATSSDFVSDDKAVEVTEADDEADFECDTCMIPDADEAVEDSTESE